MKILGIDPGTQVVGFGLIELDGNAIKPLAGGLIRPARSPFLGSRLREIHEKMVDLLTRCRPDIVAVEEVFHGRNTATLIKIGEARGVILAACALEGIETSGHSPAEVKKAVTGKGNADKSQVREMVGRILGYDLSHERDDVSDALAVAICHAHRTRFKELGIG